MISIILFEFLLTLYSLNSFKHVVRKVDSRLKYYINDCNADKLNLFNSKYHHSNSFYSSRYSELPREIISVLPPLLSSNANIPYQTNDVIYNNNDGTTDTNTIISILNDIKKEIANMKSRMDKIEKTATSNIQNISIKGKSTPTPVSSFIDSIASYTHNNVEMNTRTIEISSIVSFFIIGSIISSSLFDRLWLLGGLSTAWWASEAVRRDSREGQFVRRVGVQVLQLIRDIQEKYNQAIIFYRTGRLAYVTSKTWDQYDEVYGITKKMNEFKRLAMIRASNLSINGGSSDIINQMSDIWNAFLLTPQTAVIFDKKYGVTSSISTFTAGLWSTTSEVVNEIMDSGQ
eukprot:gene12890-17271_t